MSGYAQRANPTYCTYSFTAKGTTKGTKEEPFMFFFVSFASFVV